MSVMQVPRLIVPEFTLGAAVSNNTQERPSAKQSPGELNCASAGIGTVPHLACEYLNKIAHTNILHVPYRDVNSATMATVGNVTQMFFGVSTSAKSQIDSNTLRGLAVSTSQRSLLLPHLPTM